MVFDEKEYMRRPEVKEYYRKLNKKWREDNFEKRKKYEEEYEQRPEVKARKKEYEQRLEVKAKRKEYRKRPEVKEKRKIYLQEYDQRPKRKAYKKEYNQKPEVKARRNKLNSRIESVSKRKEYNQRSEVKARKRKYISKLEVKAKRKEYLNKPEVKNKINERDRKRRKNNESFNLQNNLRSHFSKSLKLYSETGKIMPIKKYDVDVKAIIEHLKPFPKDIENYEVDHIIPLSKFDHNNLEQVRRAWTPKNHAWLLKGANRRKGNKLVHPNYYKKYGYNPTSK